LLLNRLAATSTTTTISTPARSIRSSLLVN
jgi:hypothetical protein